MTSTTVAQAKTLSPVNERSSETGDHGWNSLYTIGGAAALLSAVFFPIQIIAFIICPPPSATVGWFQLLQNNRLMGLLDLDILLLADQALATTIFLALYMALRRAGRSLMAIGALLGLVSAALFIASNPAFAMLSLSNQYAAAKGETERTVFLAAGQAIMAMWQGSAFQMSYLLGSLAPIIISVVMLRTRIFSRATAYWGIVANVMALGLFVPKIGAYISVSSVVFLWIWYLLVARRLFQLGRTAHQGDKLERPIQ